MTECPNCMRRTEHHPHKSGPINFLLCAFCGYATPTEHTEEEIA
jgi:hypothetical protein